ncbi:hypothetical protein ACOM2C_00040 [Pseudarthrobacter sp. So.54]
MHVGPADAPVRAELAQGFAVVPGGVGGEAHGFADGGEAAAAAAGREGVLERQLRLVINQAASHHEVAGHPLGTVVLKGPDLVLGGAVQFLARDVVINLRGPLAIGTVGTAEIPGVRHSYRAVLRAVATELARAGLATVKATCRTVLTAAKRLAIVAVTIRLPVTVSTAAVRRLPVSAAGTEAAAFPATFTRGTVTIRLPVTVSTAAVRRLPVSAASAPKLRRSPPPSRGALSP